MDAAEERRLLVQEDGDHQALLLPSLVKSTIFSSSIFELALHSSL
jgi:hypothetical protein